jgi:hypothetical protein
VNHPKPDSVTKEAWDALTKAKAIITEHFPNIAIFVNWVNDEGETKHGEILEGNAFALRHHIEKYLDGDFLPDEMESEDDDSEKQPA